MNDNDADKTIVPNFDKSGGTVPVDPVGQGNTMMKVRCQSCKRKIKLLNSRIMGAKSCPNCQASPWEWDIEPLS